MRRIVRFILVGATNSLGSLALLVVLSHHLDLRLAYVIAYSAGLAYTTLLTSRFVFGAHLDARRAALFVGGYLGTLAFGLLLATALQEGSSLPPAASAVLIVGATAPLNYTVGHLVFAGSAGAP